MRLSIFVTALSCLLVACGGGGGQDPILGTPNSDITPRVISTTPVKQSPIVTGVATDARLTAKFNAAMAPSSLNTTSFTVACPANTPVTSTVTYDAANKMAILRHAAPFPANTTCEAKVSTAATNTAGAPLVADYLWSFTTQSNSDATVPTILSFSPTSTATHVCLTKSVSVTFSKPMKASTITSASFFVGTLATPSLPGTITYDARNNTATFTANSSFIDGTVHTINVTAGAKDMAETPAVPATSLFTTDALSCTPSVTVNLGAIATYGAFGGGAGVTNSGVNTVIYGDLGTTAACTLITGFDDANNFYTETPLNIGDVTGHVYCATGTIGTAITGLANARAAYDELAAKRPTVLLGPTSGELGGLPPVRPGTYRPSASTFLLGSGNLTLDAEGDADAVWVFQVPASLTIGLIGTSRSVLLINGAQAKNVYWQVGSAARIENGSTMVGTIIASDGVTISTAGQTIQTTLAGRAIGLDASVTMVNTTVTVP
ncbi:ice-binding family protein [Limnohabitans sp.]|uniref:ice-binding family protein n=1 Tax=Limnohabitans sp. TaxID=1907725 RepID=UPI00286F519C|nr:ice-binding family protein [Limnohabitans sp.]